MLSRHWLMAVSSGLTLPLVSRSLAEAKGSTGADTAPCGLIPGPDRSPSVASARLGLRSPNPGPCLRHATRHRLARSNRGRFGAVVLSFAGAADADHERGAAGRRRQA